MTCDTCHDLGGQWGAPVRNFRQSHEEGCLLCGLVLGAIEAFAPGWENNCFEGSVRRFNGAWGLPVELSSKDTPELIKFVVLGDANKTKNSFWEDLKLTSIVQNTSSEEAFSCATAWLAHCLEQHENCKLPNHAFAPRRLINVGSLKTAQEQFLFDPCPPCEYVCLSYCWVSDIDDIVTLTTYNIEAFKKRIELSSLPRTLQDAIIFIRGIGIKYLWIDSICILQDSQDDWARESGKMGQIYAHSLMTICAHFPSSCKMRFLGEQECGKETWQRSFLVEGSDGPKIMFVRRHDWLNTMNSSTSSLSLRGWTIQESILPARILHINGKELAWECNEKCFCECGHLKDNTYAQTEFPMLKKMFSLRRTGFGNERKATLTDSWEVAVEQFSKRSLTNEIDTLAAVSGIAQIISDPSSLLHKLARGEFLERTYLAGVWLEALPEGLLWETVGPKKFLTRPSQYRAPTWSWASINGPVRFKVRNTEYKRELDSHIKILDYKIVQVDSVDLMGPVKSAYLLLTGSLAPVQLITSKGNHHTFIRGENLERFQVALDLPRDTDLDVSHPSYLCWDIEQCRLYPQRCAECYFGNTEAAFYCLQVASGNYPTMMYFLVIKPSSIPGTFERFGIGRGSVMESAGSLFKDIEVTTLKLV